MSEAPKPLTERAANIVREWNAGASASDLAEMNKVTRSSILGTIHRARAAGHFVVHKGFTGHQQREKKPAARAEKRIPVQRTVESDLVVDPNAGRHADRQAKMQAPGAGEGVPFALSGDTCQRPLWGLEAKTGNVCGLPFRIEPDEQGVDRPKRPYCDFHYQKAYPGRA